MLRVLGVEAGDHEPAAVAAQVEAVAVLADRVDHERQLARVGPRILEHDDLAAVALDREAEPRESATRDGPRACRVDDHAEPRPDRRRSRRPRPARPRQARRSPPHAAPLRRGRARARRARRTAAAGRPTPSRGPKTAPARSSTRSAGASRATSSGLDHARSVVVTELERPCVAAQRVLRVRELELARAGRTGTSCSRESRSSSCAVACVQRTRSRIGVERLDEGGRAAGRACGEVRALEQQRPRRLRARRGGRGSSRRRRRPPTTTTSKRSTTGQPNRERGEGPARAGPSLANTLLVTGVQPGKLERDDARPPRAEHDDAGVEVLLRVEEGAVVGRVDGEVAVVAPAALGLGLRAEPGERGLLGLGHLAAGSPARRPV